MVSFFFCFFLFPLLSITLFLAFSSFASRCGKPSSSACFSDSCCRSGFSSFCSLVVFVVSFYFLFVFCLFSAFFSAFSSYLFVDYAHFLLCLSMRLSFSALLVDAVTFFFFACRCGYLCLLLVDAVIFFFWVSSPAFLFCGFSFGSMARFSFFFFLPFCW